MPKEPVKILGFLELGVLGRPITKRHFKRAGWLVLALLAALMVVRLVGGVVMQYKFDAALEDLRKRGEPVTLDEMTPDVADDENGALLYERAFKQLGALNAEGKGCLDRLRWKRRPPTAEERNEVRALLEKAREPLRLIRQAVNRPKCWFARVYGTPFMQRQHPYLKDIQRSAFLLRSSSEALVEERKADAAIAECVTLLKVARAVHNDPAGISFLVEMACCASGLNAVKAVMDRLEPSAGALRQTVEALGDIEDRSRFVLALRGERCEYLPTIAKGTGVPEDWGYPSAAHPREQSRVADFMLRPIILADALTYLEIMDTYVGLAQKPWHESKEQWEQQNLHIEQILSTMFRRRPYTRHLLCGSYHLQCARNFDHYVSRKGCAAQAIALRLYRMKHGQYPEDVAALVPEFLDKLPTDPFSGKDFIYRREGKGFIVYSVGIDRKDDGGVEVPKNRELDDIVWTCSR